MTGRFVSLYKVLSLKRKSQLTGEGTGQGGPRRWVRRRVVPAVRTRELAVTMATGAPDPSSAQGWGGGCGGRAWRRQNRKTLHWNSCRGLDTVGRVEAGLVLRTQKTKQTKTRDCY